MVPFKKIFSVMSFLLIILAGSSEVSAIELIIGEKRVQPGIIFIFEGAIKDQILPDSLHLTENETHVHIEAQVNWAHDRNIPKGAPAGGFVPYLRITAKITNQKTGLSTFIDMLPHINLIDNFHYARNISLPGGTSDLYSVVFTVIPPTYKDLALHRDWVNSYSGSLMQEQVFRYEDVNFAEIAAASRRQVPHS